MVIAIVIILIFGILWIKHKNDYKEIFDNLSKKKNELKTLYPIAYRILQLLMKCNINFSNSARKREIGSLNVIEEQKESELIYNIKRTSLALLIILVGAVFCILYELSLGESQISDKKLMRPGYSRQAELYRVLANGNEIQIEVNPKEYTLDEVSENFTKAYEYILNEMKGDNISLSEVDTNLNLVSYIDEYDINVSWTSSAPEIVDMYGAVNNYDFDDEEVQNLTLTVTLSYLEYECQYNVDICVVAPKLAEEENFMRKLINSIKESEVTSRTEDLVVLPDTIENVPVSYEHVQDNYGLLLLVMAIVTAVVIFPGMDKDLEQKMNDRKKEMLLDYSEIVSKLNILSGSGMSILNAWEKIVKDYEKKVLGGVIKRRFAYEEMKITYYEIKSGESESNAYSNFGKRCNIHEYLKLGALLEQNVRKGAKGMAKMLENEANQAFEQRKNLAKKLGEEAGTKMLIPMIAMLAIVMIIVLIPAFTSFGV